MKTSTNAVPPVPLARLVSGLFDVLCYRSIGVGMSVPDVWISGQSKESADYHAWHGRMIQRWDAGCYHGPFRIVPANERGHARAQTE
jgi:hypothetical protein